MPCPVCQPSNFSSVLCGFVCFPKYFIITSTITTPISGNSVVTSIPAFNPICSAVKCNEAPMSAAKELADTLSMTIPMSCGATEAPKSPPAAIKAYAATPGEGIFSSIIINVPGQSIAVNIHAIKESTTLVESPAMR